MISLKCYINFKVRFLGNMVPISNLAHLILQMTPIFILGFQYLKILLSNTSLVLRIIQKLFFIVIISGTEYSFNENTI